MLGLSCNMQDLVPWPGMKPRPPALAAQGLHQWTTREVSIFAQLFLCSIGSEYPCTGIMWIWKFLSLLCWSGLLIPCCWHFSSNEPHESLASSTCPQDYRLCFLSHRFKCGDSMLSAGTSISALQHPKFLGPIALEHKTTQNVQSTLPSMNLLALRSSVSPWLRGFLFSY